MIFADNIFYLQMYLEQGAYVKHQDDKWWLFDKGGDGIESGKNLYDLIAKLKE